MIRQWPSMGPGYLDKVALAITYDEERRMWWGEVFGVVPHVCAHDYSQPVEIRGRWALTPRTLNRSLMRLVECAIRGDESSALAIVQQMVEQRLTAWEDTCPLTPALAQ